MAKLVHGTAGNDSTTITTSTAADDNSGKPRDVTVDTYTNGGNENAKHASCSTSAVSAAATTSSCISADASGYERKAYIIGICGGSASGKTTVARNIIQDLHVMGPPKACVLISMDSFYRDFNARERELAFINEFNFDVPGAFDFELLRELLQKMKDKQPVDIPQYSFVKHAREKDMVTHVEPAEIVLFEGILAFHDPLVAALCDLKIFVDIDPDIRLARRLQRDIVERGRDLPGALKQYERSVKPSFDQFIAPTKPMADIIVPRGGENRVAIDIIIEHLSTRLQTKQQPINNNNSVGMPRPKLHVQAVAGPSLLSTTLQNQMPRSASMPHAATGADILNDAGLLVCTTGTNEMFISNPPLLITSNGIEGQQRLKRVAVTASNGDNCYTSYPHSSSDEVELVNTTEDDQIKNNSTQATLHVKELSNGYHNGASTVDSNVTSFSRQNGSHRHVAESSTLPMSNNFLTKRAKYTSNSPQNGLKAVQSYHNNLKAPPNHQTLIMSEKRPSSSSAAVSASALLQQHELLAVDSA